MQPAVGEGVYDSRERMRTLCLMFPSEIGDAAWVADRGLGLELQLGNVSAAAFPQGGLASCVADVA